LVEAIDRTELLRLIEDNSVQVVDVLPKPEFDRSHIPGAINIPLKTLDEETTRALDRGKPVAVY
jgi:rhodanese-related sulfurtransferase